MLKDLLFIKNAPVNSMIGSATAIISAAEPGGEMKPPFTTTWEGETISFCPFCGRPLTDEAWTELKKRLEGHYATSDWISVKDRLPEESGDYLALQNSVNQYVLHFSSRHQAFNCYDFDEIAKYKITDITHWMELPEPPKEFAP